MRWMKRKPADPPEDSIPMRVVVAVAVELAIVAVVAQHAVDATSAVAALLLAPLGYWFSYRRRYRPNVLIKIGLAIGLLAAMGQFLGRVESVLTVDEARLPLASLFLWVQMLHAFDVPRRRDLAFSMISSVILLAEAAALSLTTGFLVFLVPWAGLTGWWLYLSSFPRPDRLTTPVSVRRILPASARGKRVAPVRAAATPALMAVVAAFVMFLAMPRVPGTLVKTPPFSLSRSPSAVNNFQGGVSNPNLPPPDADGVVDFTSGGYPGLSNVVDLRARGRLSNRIAFLVRSPQPALYRAEGFDTYDGSTWTMSTDRTSALPQGDEAGSFDVPLPTARALVTSMPEVTLTQTFYIETPQPNIVFGAAVPGRVYFPAGGLRVDRYGSIRSPILLDQGMVYSVVSEVPVADPVVLRHASTHVPAAIRSDLQLPSTLPARVGALSASITRGATTEYDKVQDVQAWIRRHTSYNLNVPADPAGVDEVDHFLFVTRQGFCEQIASAMAVMLRTLGVPTRLVTGYGPGTRNPFTGYFEVHDSDAHAWLEVYYPRVGWVPYDPTFGVPPADPSVSSRFMAGPVFAAVGRFLSRVTPAPVKRAVGVTLRAVGSVARSAWEAWPLALAILALAAVAFAGWRRVRVRRRRGPPVFGPERAFVDLAEVLGTAGHPRAPHLTPSEYLWELSHDRTFDPEVAVAAGVVVRTFERERFAADPPSASEVAAALATVDRVRRLVATRR